MNASISNLNKQTNKINPFLDKNVLKNLRNSTPFFVFSKQALLHNLKDYQNSLPPKTEICYSMKANSEKPVLQTLNEASASFELASNYELTLLKTLNVPAQRIIFGSSVKASNHIKDFVKYGVDRFACDSEEELFKISKHAQGSRVYIRALVDNKADSVFHMSEKFGVPLKETIDLLIKAKNLGLVPYGISFNVGSQARNEYAWARGIADVASAMLILSEKGIKLQVINIGGGFPHKYEGNDRIPTIKEISKHISGAIKKLPYPVNLIVEPGRGLVANTYVLVTSITEKIMRHNGYWLHLDAGVYNALLEAMAYQGSIRYRIEPMDDYPSSTKEKFILTGPCCDDLDVIEEDALLPNKLKVSDKLIIYDTGAYTFTLMTRFNGYPKPKTVLL